VETIAAISARKLGKFLTKDFLDIFGSTHNETAERLGALARSAIECIARSDALYHNFEHTMLVTIVGRDILRGRQLTQIIEPEDYTHLICACLLHDIGFVRGVLSGDTLSEFVIDKDGHTVTLPRGASDASLAPYHVDRSKLFAYERLGNSPQIDPARVAVGGDSAGGVRGDHVPVTAGRTTSAAAEPAAARRSSRSQRGDRSTSPTTRPAPSPHAERASSRAPGGA